MIACFISLGNSKAAIYSDSSNFNYFSVGVIPLNPSNAKQSGEEIILNHIGGLIEAFG